MLKKIKKILPIILIVIVFAGIGIFAAFQKKGKPIELPREDQVETLHINVFRIDGGASYEVRLKTLMDGVENAKPMTRWEAQKHQSGENPYVLGFFYKNGKRDFFNFYKNGEEWFMKTQEGNVYSDVAFIAELAEPDEAVSSGDEIQTSQYEFSISSEVFEYAEKTGFGLNYQFANAMNVYCERMSFDEALETTIGILQGKSFLYQYALEQGCEATDEEVQKGYIGYLFGDEEWKEFNKQLESALEKTGVSKDSYLKGMREADKITIAIEKLRLKKRQEFIEGKDYLEGVEYNSAGEYWDAFRNSLARAALEDGEYEEIMDKINKDIEKAKQTYLEYFGEDAS